MPEQHAPAHTNSQVNRCKYDETTLGVTFSTRVFPA